jgi:uncharacterized SAM-binding protein YcdF (DUF218 family)
VVLTGGKGRLEEGFEQLIAHPSSRLFISGVGENVKTEELIEQMPSALRQRLRTIPKQHISLGHRARNTIGNAEETREWLKSNSSTHIMLVTSNYHMPRSLSEFHALMPHIDIAPVPVFSDDVVLTQWWADNDSREVIFSEYHKYIASKLRHWFVSDSTSS